MTRRELAQELREMAVWQARLTNRNLEALGLAAKQLEADGEDTERLDLVRRRNAANAVALEGGGVGWGSTSEKNHPSRSHRRSQEGGEMKRCAKTNPQRGDAWIKADESGRVLIWDVKAVGESWVMVRTCCSERFPSKEEFINWCESADFLQSSEEAADDRL